jgi:ACS family hexuronate transporter-like MFS transporter
VTRWWILGVFVLSTAINYLDRQTLAMLAPAIRSEFGLSNADYGWVLTAFSLTYMAAAPLAGLFIDRVGLTLGITLAVGLWSAAGVATGFTSGLGELIGCRAALGLAEAGGIPAAGKAIHLYLKPEERALGNALNQAGVSFGLILAPPIATALALAYGWRNAFVLTGVLGFLWIPLWLAAARGRPTAKGGTSPGAELLTDRRLWVFVLANALSMTGYSLWTNWTTLYLVDVAHLNMAQAALYAWIPPVFAMAGGFLGGWLSLKWMRAGAAAIPARLRACRISALGSLLTAAIPFLPGPVGACAGISWSILAVAAFSVNMYTLPLDAFGGARAAFAVSMLVAGYGAIQALVSPAFGALIDNYGYAPACAIAALAPLAAYGVLGWSESANI